MKKIFVFAIAICLFAGNVNSQKIYLRLGLGGGVGLKQYEGFMWANETITSTTHDEEYKSLGFGGGLNVNLAGGFMLSDNIGIELGVNEFIGLNKTTKVSDTRAGFEESREVKVSGMMLQLVPAIVITPKLEKLNPYARLGMIIGILPSFTEKISSTQTVTPVSKATLATTQIEYKEKNNGGIALGFTAAAGVDMNLSDNLSLFGELVYNGITYAPTKGKVKTWTVNGVDQIATAVTRDKEWTYEKKIDTDAAIPDGSADKREKQSFNFSNVLINIGIKLHL